LQTNTTLQSLNLQGFILYNEDLKEINTGLTVNAKTALKVLEVEKEHELLHQKKTLKPLPVIWSSNISKEIHSKKLISKFDAIITRLEQRDPTTGKMVGDPALTEVDLSNESLSLMQVERLATALTMNCYVSFLDLQSTSLKKEAGVLLANVLETNTSLQELLLDFNGLCDEGFEKIAIVLTSKPSLKVLSVSENKLTHVSGKSLKTLLQSNTTLQSLNLSNNNLGDNGLAEIATGLAANPKTALEFLDMDNNKLTATSGNPLKTLLQTNASLRTLNLAHNDLGDKGFTEIAAGLAVNPKARLKLLNMHDNGLTYTSSETLKKLLQVNYSLAEIIGSSTFVYVKDREFINKALERNQAKTKTTLSAPNLMGSTSLVEDDEKTTASVSKSNKLQEVQFTSNDVTFRQSVTASSSMVPVISASHAIRMFQTHNPSHHTQSQSELEIEAVNTEMICTIL
jgi:Ran GTPase-activating protein (RanGAP) involved in mRNA processing and transport